MAGWRLIRNMNKVITYKKGNKLIEIYNRRKGFWTVTKYQETPNIEKLWRKGFIKKTSALEYAKKYMAKF